MRAARVETPRREPNTGQPTLHSSLAVYQGLHTIREETNRTRFFFLEDLKQIGLYLIDKYKKGIMYWIIPRQEARAWQ